MHSRATSCFQPWPISLFPKLQTALYLAAPKSSRQLGVLPIRSHLTGVYIKTPLSSSLLRVYYIALANPLFGGSKDQSRRHPAWLLLQPHSGFWLGPMLLAHVTGLYVHIAPYIYLFTTDNGTVCQLALKLTLKALWSVL